MNQLCLLFVLSSVLPAMAQHQHRDHLPNPPASQSATTDSMPGRQHHQMMTMSHSFSRSLPMNRNGSGTSWHPDNTPMYAYMLHTPKNWMYMLHYSVFLRHTNQNFTNPTGRGRDRQFDAPNWFMGMAQRTVGQRGLFMARAMLSFDPLTVSPNGYPLLFQSGESYQGRRLVDRQHQHDLFSELAVAYSYAFSNKSDAFLYVGFPGEPALGPPAFMHRLSAFNNPDSPLGHHWHDATHITFGVVTAGYRLGMAKIEASSFTGREPDENRLGLDRPRFDSYSFRFSVNPSPAWALQVSHGFLKSPESVEPEEDVNRTTASVLHSKSLGSPDRYVTSALVWGMNSHDGTNENAYLAETSLQLNRVALHGRFENITKSQEELGIINNDAGTESRLVTVNNATLGMNFRLVRYAMSDLVLGTQITASMPDQFLQSLYGKMPLSGQIYLRLTPGILQASSRSAHTGHAAIHEPN
ncbi:hypothetical protein AWR27_04965 [Spirosoma montaniterrae]|uniref:Alginate export domain-containing protein n=2 Tax=Spirosoma montaniterrae TaxID=1178516 RepID=A0A1P9X402_9BACT|nr:hypothetical protein AWR27_04965 [Spirosoma montaniterrae]